MEDLTVTHDRPRFGRHRLRVAALYLLFLLVLGEGLSRAFWSVLYGRPFLTTEPLLNTFYPEVRSAVEGVELHDEPFDVLLLGASVLTSVVKELREQLTLGSARQIRVHNLAVGGHTTLDSYYKYHAIREVPFDLVVVYHGINELRANNAPPDVFQPDYSHYAWYGFLNDDGRRMSRQWILLPETAHWIGGKVRELLGDDLVGMHRPRDDWLEFGSDYKSVASFRANMLGIREIAAAGDTPLLLMTFAHYLAPGYTLEAFGNRDLDYLEFERRVEIWGLPQVIDRGIDTHNEVLSRIARMPGTLFVDQAANIPDGRRYYNDICHLTNEGARVFVANLMPVVLPLLGGRRNDGLIPAQRLDTLGVDQTSGTVR